MAVSNIYGNGTTTASAGANTIVHYYDRAGIKAANRKNVYGQFADKKSIPTKTGKTFKISKFLHMYDREQFEADGVTIKADFAAKGYMTARTADEVTTLLANAALSEGAQDVNKRSLKKITMQTSVARYGEMIDYTDEVDIFSEDYIQVKYREELGELANARYEDLLQLDMLGTPTVMFSGTAVAKAGIGSGVADDGSDDADWKVSYELIKKATRKLMRNRAKKNTSVVTGSTKIDTRSVAKAYYAIIDADVKADLENATRGSVSANGFTEYMFIPAQKYADAATLAEGEVGAMHEVRFIESESAVVFAGEGADVGADYVGSLAYTGTAGVDGKFDVHAILFPTEGAFATVSLKGMDRIKFRAQSPEAVQLNNPYGTQGFFSYNFFYAGIILEPEKLLAVYVGASK